MKRIIRASIDDGAPLDKFKSARLGPIRNIPPAEAEERYYAMMEQSAMAA